MRGNTFGKLLSITTFGESHGPYMGVVIDGMLPNIAISQDDLWDCLKRRAPGQKIGTTTRNEQDYPEIVSGVFEGKTLGSPICILFKNSDARSRDYAPYKSIYRPGHADRTTELKYGIRDYRGGGRASGRETIGRVAGGYFASLILSEVKIHSYCTQMGRHCFPLDHFKDEEFDKEYFIPVKKVAEVRDYLQALQLEGNSCGGEIMLEVTSVPPALGEPCFDKLKADLMKAIGSVGAVTGVGVGDFLSLSNSCGKHAGDNRAVFGGIEGGISNGDTVRVTAYIKPTSTVGKMAKEGRHDPCIIPRVIPVLESMIMLTLADHFLRQRAYENQSS